MGSNIPVKNEYMVHFIYNFIISRCFATWICCGFSFGAKLLELVQFLFSFFFCIHYHNLEQWQIKLKPIIIKKTLNRG